MKTHSVHFRLRTVSYTTGRPFNPVTRVLGSRCPVSPIGPLLPRARRSTVKWGAVAIGLFDVVHRGGVQSAFGPTQQHSILDTEMCVDSGVPYVSAAGQPSEPQSPEPQSHLGLFESPFEPLACLKLSLLSCSRFLLSFLKSVCPVRRIPRFVGPTAIRPSLGGDRRLTR